MIGVANSEYFSKTRKALGFSQRALCAGICTQATLSKFEKQQQIPSIKIMLQLCNRLNLTLDSVFPTNHTKSSVMQKKLDQAEFNLILSQWTVVQSLIDDIKLSQLVTPTLKMQYYCISGYLSALTNQDLTETAFLFSHILNDLDEPHQTIFTYLAYCGIGIAYSQQHDLEKAQFYFDKVLTEIDHWSLDAQNTVWRVLNMRYFTAVFFADLNQLTTSNALLQTAVTICQQKHVTYYLARIYYQLAVNLAVSPNNATKKQQYLNDAAAFARINGNAVLLKQITTQLARR